MRKIRTAVFAGIAALTAAGTAVAATADTRVVNVGLPDGSVARIEYHGDVAPKVALAPRRSSFRSGGSIRSKWPPLPCSTGSQRQCTAKPR